MRKKQLSKYFDATISITLSKLQWQQKGPWWDFRGSRDQAFRLLFRGLGSNNDLGQVLGGQRTVDKSAGMLCLFCPKHELFEEIRAGKKDPSRCIPMFIHGDEGTAYKKGGVLVLSLQGSTGLRRNTWPRDHLKKWPQTSTHHQK